MLTLKDKKALEFSNSRITSIIEVVFILALLTFLVSSFINLYTASRIGSIEGHDLFSLMKYWPKSITTSSNYSSIYLKAMERIIHAFISFLVSICLAGQLIAIHLQRQRNKRIISTLKAKNAWN